MKSKLVKLTFAPGACYNETDPYANDAGVEVGKEGLVVYGELVSEDDGYGNIVVHVKNFSQSEDDGYGEPTYECFILEFEPDQAVIEEVAEVPVGYDFLESTGRGEDDCSWGDD